MAAPAVSRKYSRRVAAMPFEQLQKIAAVEGLVQKARGKHDETVGAVYDTIRKVNARVGELADSALNKVSRQKAADS